MISFFFHVPFSHSSTVIVAAACVIQLICLHHDFFLMRGCDVQGDAFKENMHIFLGDGIFNADGEEWRRQRKTASFEFSSKILRDFSTVVFKEYTLNLAEILDNAATAHQAVDMQVAGLKFQNLMRAEMPEVVQECLKVVGIIVKSISF